MRRGDGIEMDQSVLYIPRAVNTANPIWGETEVTIHRAGNHTEPQS